MNTFRPRPAIAWGACLPLLLLAAGCFRGGNGSGTAGYPELELVAALPVDCAEPVEPSGLTCWKGQLYAVADKANGTIYRVEIGSEAARLVPAIRFRPPEEGVMDWEGITVDAGGSFYLVSEELGRVLRVSADGQANWASPDLRPAAREAGLFRKSNAGFEGIAWLGPNHWLGAVEREPRGLVEWWRSNGSISERAFVHEVSPFSDALPLLRLPDYAGLDTDNGTVFALFRNAHLVVRLEQAADGFTEAEAWSYRHIETDPRWAYRSQTYGQAEGLVVEGSDVFLVFDNNLGGRQANPKDGRPLLVHARFPRQR